MSDELSDVTIRRGTAEDAASFRRCLDAVARERRWLAFLEAPSLEEVNAFLSRYAPIQFVAERSGEVVGWCDLTPNPREGFRHGGAVGMGLLPAYRGRGLGRALLERTLAAAREAGLTRIELEVLASNESAIALYERLGFEHEGRKRAARLLDGTPDDLLCMALLLPAE